MKRCLRGIFFCLLFFFILFYRYMDTKAASYQLQSITYNAANPNDTVENHNKERITVKYQYINNSGTKSTRYRQYLLQNGSTKQRAYISQCEYELPDSFVEVNGSITQARKLVLGLRDVLCGFRLNEYPIYDWVGSYDEMNAFAGVRECIQNNFINTPITVTGNMYITSMNVEGRHEIKGTANNNILELKDEDQYAFHVYDGVSLTLDNIRLQGVTSKNLRYPMINNSGTITIKNSSLSGHIYEGTKDSGEANAYGGAILNHGMVNLESGAVISNNQSVYGGGIKMCTASILNIKEGSRISDNKAVHGGNIAMGGSSNHYATVNMYGGNIEHGIVSNWGVKKADGTLLDNGLGGNLYITSDSYFNMQGGGIDGGQAKQAGSYGADIFAWNGAVIEMHKNAAIGEGTNHRTSNGESSAYIKDAALFMYDNTAIYAGDCTAAIRQEHNGGHMNVDNKPVNSFVRLDGGVTIVSNNYAIIQQGNSSSSRTATAHMETSRITGKLYIRGKQATMIAGDLKNTTSVINEGGNFDSTGNIDCTLTNDGKTGTSSTSKMKLSGSRIEGSISNNGESDVITANGITFSGKSFTNHGTVTLTDCGEILSRPVNTGTFIINKASLTKGFDCKNGTLTIKEGSITNSSATVPAIAAEGKSVVTVEGGNIINQNGVAISNNGTSLTITGGLCRSNTGADSAIQSHSNMFVYGGVITSNGNGIYQVNGNVTLGGNSSSSFAVISSGDNFYDVYKACNDTNGKLIVSYNQDDKRMGAAFSKVYLTYSASISTYLPRHLYNVTTSNLTHKITSPNTTLSITVPEDDYWKGRVIATCNKYTYDDKTLSADDFAKNEVSLNKMTIPNDNAYYLKASGQKIVIWRREYTLRFHNNQGTGVMKDILISPEKAYSDDEKVILGFSRDNCLFEGFSYQNEVKDYVTCDSKDSFDKTYGTTYKSKQTDILVEGVYHLSESQAPDNSIIELYARWSPIPVIIVDSKINGEERLFYEDEIAITLDILKMGINVYDGRDGDITNKLSLDKISYANGMIQIPDADTTLKTDTNVIGKASIFVSAKNSLGGMAAKEISFDIKKNAPPYITIQDQPDSAIKEIWDRLNTVKDMTKNEINKLLFTRVTLSDDVENRDELLVNHLVEGDFEQNKELSPAFPLVLGIKDQYGHRFYMKSGEKKQYGKGKTSKIDVIYNILDERHEIAKREGFARAISKKHFPHTLLDDSRWRAGEYYEELHDVLYSLDPQKEEDCQQIWRYTAKDRKRMRILLEDRGMNPYTKEAREDFWEEFNHCRIK